MHRQGDDAGALATVATVTRDQYHARTPGEKPSRVHLASRTGNARRAQPFSPLYTRVRASECTGCVPRGALSP